MPSAVTPRDKSLQETLILLRRMVQMLSQQNAVDGANRQRIVIDAITGGLTLTTVGNVTTVANIAAIAGEGVRQFEVPARNNYANSIRRNLVFG